ncbi:MAG TPA: glycosyltransferase family 87 protein [Vicinamibacterales bacterium]
MKALSSRRLWLLVGVANVAAGVWIACRPAQSRDVWTVAHWCRDWLLSGVSPYPGAEFRTNYPPYALVLLSPLAIIPDRILGLTWSLISAALAVTVGWLGLKASGVTAREHEALVVSIGFFLAWESLRVGLGLGQFTLVALACGLGAVVSRERVTRGVLLGLSMIKPQIGVAFLLWAMLEGAWASVVISALPIVLGTIVFAARLGQSPLGVAAAYSDVFLHQVSGAGFRQGSLELRPLIHDVVGTAAVADMIHTAFVAATLVFLVFAHRRMSTANRSLFLLPLTCLWTLMSVYHAAYDLVLLWPATIALWSWQLRARAGAGVIAVLAALQLALIVDIPGLWWKVAGRPESPAFEGWGPAVLQHFDRFLVVALFATLIALSIRSRPAVTASTSTSFSEEGLTPQMQC